MSDDIRYETLIGRYNAIVTERDRLQVVNENLQREVTNLNERLIDMLTKPREMMAIVCDGGCGRAVCGIDELSIREEATRRHWFLTPLVASSPPKHYCQACHRFLQLPL